MYFKNNRKCVIIQVTTNQTDVIIRTDEQERGIIMGMTMTQKILAAHAGLPYVEAGQLIEADLDLVLGNDITSPVAIHEMDKMKKTGVFDKDKIALVPDHFVPNKDIKSAEHCKCVREFAKKNEITNYFEVGQMGIEHALLPEKGLTVAGDVVIGADSHTCTYGDIGNDTAVKIDIHLITILDIPARLCTLYYRKTDVDGIAVKDSCECLSYYAAHTCRLDCDRSMLPGRTAAEVLISHNYISFMYLLNEILIYILHAMCSKLRRIR